MIAKRIKELRKINGISQQKLATALGISQAAVNKWENGTCYPKTETLKVIAKMFDVSLEYLLGTAAEAAPTLSHEAPLHIKELRTKHGITAKQLGEIIGVAESTISLYETGKRSPNYSTLMKIADYFNVTVDYLLGREDLPQDESSIRPSPFPDNLKELRTARQLTQTALAEQLGVSRSTVAMWESGESEPNIETILFLCQLLNTTPSALLDVDSTPSNLTDTDRKLLDAYHAADPDIRFAVDLILKKHGK